ncbi:MAG: hypothetical protein AB1728_10660 [Bacteroidota bacterium]
MKILDRSTNTNSVGYKRFGKRLAKLGFWFFLIKGILWLAAPFIISYLALNS